MKQGYDSVQALALELKRQAQHSFDITAPTTALAVRHVFTPEVVTPVEVLAEPVAPTAPLVPQTMLVVGDEGEFVVSDITHRQISQHLGIHAKFYDRIRAEQPDMLEYNVNEMFKRYRANRLVRTLDGRARAFLGNSYNVGLSNMALAEYLLPVIGELGGEVRSSAITDRKAYVKIVLPTIEREVKRVGQVIRLGVVLYNSEIGFGKWGFDLFTETLKCTNGMTVENTGFAKAHLGKALGDGETVRRFLTSETRAAEDKALMLGSRDVLKGLLTESTLEAHVEALELAAETPIVKVKSGDAPDGKVAEVVTRISKSVGLNESEGASVLDHLINGGDLSIFGLANAVTRTAEDSASYDRASELERLGGQMVTMPRDKWGIEGDGDAGALALE
jgi:hypothetical protein